MMNVLIITPFYLPDGGPAAPLFTMLCEELVKRGNQVTVITAVPHYPSGKVKNEFKRNRPCETVENGVDVIRVPLPSVNRSILPLRLIQLIVYQIGATVVGVRRHYDVMFLNNPFFMTGIPLFFLGVIRRKPFVYAVYDVYPDIGIQTGIFRNKWVIQLVTAFEKYCLQKATLVRLLSKSFIPPIIGMGIPEKKIRLIYDWVDIDLIQPMSKNNEFSRENGLADKFVILYAGNVGLSQGLEIVLDVAARFISQLEVQFVFVGDGAGKRDLLEKTNGKGLSNVKFLPFQPRDLLPQVLASADVSLIILKRGAAFGSLPSKTYSIMASGRPIIACLDPGSESSELIERSGAGITIPPEDPEALAQSIQKIMEDKVIREKFGKNGRAYVEKYHSPGKAAEQFEALFLECIKSHQ
jgi:colanic acid biosynthesis glycosyl transferase WcaI